MKTEINQEILSLLDTCKTNLDCLKILADFKWQEDNIGYKCTKCGHTKCTIRKKNLARDCNKCHYVESPTAGSLFHKLKFGVRKAFLMIFEMGTSTHATSASQMARKIGVMRATASLFMKKVRKAMEDNDMPVITGQTQVLTFAFGYKENFRPKQGRHPNRKKVVLAVELTETGAVKQVHFKAISNYSSKELRKIFDEHIDKKTQVMVEKWTGFDPLKRHYNITKISNNFQNFIQANHVVHDLKTMLRSTYTSVKQKYLQSYLDEFSFKINHSNEKENLFDILIMRMLNRQPLFLINK
jgi:transposase-like protein